MTENLKQTISGFEILAKLGEDSAGTVWKARQSSPNRVVALRVLSPRWAQDARLLSRVKRDVTAAVELGHPNLVQTYCVGEQDGTHYIATEFMEGETLCRRIEQRGRLEAREALAIVFYITRALLYAWSKAQLAHLDIRPEKIFLRTAGDVKLEGLGLAMLPGKPEAESARYRAPELMRPANEADQRADIYSLGCVLYHMLSGKPPFEDSDAKTLLAKHANEPPPRIAKAWPACPPSLARLLEKMLAKQPGDRHHDHDELIKELLEVRDEVKRTIQQRTTVHPNADSRAFAGYTLLGKLGQDDIGVDYRARETGAKRVVALQVLAQRFSREMGFADRFKREMSAVTRLVHQNIVEVFAAGEADGSCYIASELVEGRTLGRQMERRGQLQPREALAIAFYVAQALQHAWNTAGLAHGALSLDNILLTDDGVVKVGEFGLARIMEPAGSAPHYISPEQARGVKELDCRADIYSLGCLLYHTLTGKTPYDGDSPAAITAQHNTEPPPAILKAWPGCPASLAKLMDRMLAKSRRDRPLNYEDLLAELVNVRQEFRKVKVVGPPAPKKTATTTTEPEADESEEESVEPKPALWSQKPVWVGVGVAALILLAGLFFWTHRENITGLSSASTPHHSDDSSDRVIPFPQTPQMRLDTATAPARPEPPPSRPKPVHKPTPPAPEPLAQTRTPEAAPATIGNEIAPEPSAPSDNSLAPRATIARVGSREIMLDVPSSGGAPSEKPMTDEAFAAAVVALPPQEQVRRVVARLQELNPGFNGKASYKIESNVVAELTISTTGSLVPTVGVSDMTPIKTLRGLRRLTLAPANPGEQGALTDLSALSGMALTWLVCQGNPQLHDLSPLKDMPLTGLACGNTQVKDLSPLSGMPLATLGINDTPVEDIAALSGMPLAVVWCNNTKIGDLSPLRGAPLRELRCDFHMTRDSPVLRAIRTLARINDLPAATFWKRAEVATAAPAVVARSVKTAPDFKSLFNGKDLVGWKQRSMQRSNGWRVRRSSMVNTPPSDDLLTKDDFSNFEFYCEYQLPRRGHSGVILRGRYRIPLLDDMGSAPSTTCSGSVYELLAPTKNVSKPSDTWQALYVRLVGGTITVILNNKKVIDARDLSESGGSFADDVVKSGPISLVGTASGATFRNIRIKPLPEKKN